MTTLIENLYLKFQKCVSEVRKDLKTSSSNVGDMGNVGNAVTITIATSEAADVSAANAIAANAIAANAIAANTIAANAIAAATATTTMVKSDLATVLSEELTDDDETEDDGVLTTEEGEMGEGKAEGDPTAAAGSASSGLAQHHKKAAGKRGQTGRKKSGRGNTTEEEDNGEDKVVKILPNLIIVPPGGKPPAGTLNTAPVTVPKVLPKILPKPHYGGGAGIGVTSGMLPGGGSYIGGPGGTIITPGPKPAVSAPVVQEDLSCHICNKVKMRCSG